MDDEYVALNQRSHGNMFRESVLRPNHRSFKCWRGSGGKQEGENISHILLLGQMEQHHDLFLRTLLSKKGLLSELGERGILGCRAGCC